ncbi:MAG TPA: aspartyl protease family protein [Cyclobacteriaceae bacterium]|nr:aspartyl protease family protein [Cyclobacteriaceae bacterium]
MLRKIFLLLFLFSSQISRAQLGFALVGKERRVEFPIEIANNLVIVPIVLNGQLPLRFILDTGVRTTILTEKSFSDILNLTHSRHYLVAGPGGEKIVEAYVTNNITLDMPGVHGEGHAMLVLEKDYLELRNYLGIDVHGVLGYEVFSRFVVKIDYEHKKLTLIQPDRFKPKRGYQAMKISIEDTKPYIDTSVELMNGTKINAKLLIDSGASHGLMLDPASNKLIVVPEKHVSSLIGRGLGGLITGQIGRVKSLTLGKYKLEDVIASFPDANSYIDTLKASDVFRNGAVCGEILSRFTTIYDFSGEKLYLKKNASFPKKFYFNMSGLTIKAKGANLHNFEVTDIRKDSEAERAGIETGDLLMSINGFLTSEMNLNVINAYFNNSPGKKIRMEILRNGRPISVTLVLESPI